MFDPDTNLENVKSGDIVFVRRSGIGHRNEWTRETVERTTAKQIVISKHFRFWKETGREVGGDLWRCADAYPMTKKNAIFIEEQVEQSRRRRTKEQLVRKLENTHWDNFELEQIVDICTKIDKYNK